MNKRVAYSLIAASLTSTAFLFTNCSQMNFNRDCHPGAAGQCTRIQETNTGNPLTSDIELKLAAVTSVTVGNVSLCPQSVDVYPADAGLPPLTRTLKAIAVPLGEDEQKIATLELPVQDYDRVEVNLAAGANCGHSFRLDNAHGSFATAAPIKMKFRGPFTIKPSTHALNLSAQDIVDRLPAVSSNAQVAPTVDATDGQVLPPQSIIWVQKAEIAYPSANLTLASPAFAAAPQAGNLMVCRVVFGSIVSQLVNVTDTAGNTYHRVASTIGPLPQAAASWTLELWYAENIQTTSSFVVTANMQGSANTGHISCHEYAGAAQVNALDQFRVAGAGATNTPGTDFLATTSSFPATAGELILVVGDGDAERATSGFATRSSYAQDLVADQIVPASGDYSGSLYAINGGWWSLITATFRPATP
jgi:hypothetical protein